MGSLNGDGDRNVPKNTGVGDLHLEDFLNAGSEESANELVVSFDDGLAQETIVLGENLPERVDEEVRGTRNSLGGDTGSHHEVVEVALVVDIEGVDDDVVVLEEVGGFKAP